MCCRNRTHNGWLRRVLHELVLYDHKIAHYGADKTALI